MIVREWLPDDVKKLSLQPDQEYLKDWMHSLDYDALNEAGKAWTAESDTGEILAVAGITYQWENRGLVWSFISEAVGEHFVSFHKEVKRKIAEFQKECIRLEMTVDVGFSEGHRWAKLLGFSVEGYMRAYRPDGGDVIMYSRIRE